MLRLVAGTKARNVNAGTSTFVRALAALLLLVLLVGGHGVLTGHSAESPATETAHALDAQRHETEGTSGPSTSHLAGLCLVLALAAASLVYRRRSSGASRRRHYWNQRAGRRNALCPPSTRAVIGLTGVCLR